MSRIFEVQAKNIDTFRRKKRRKLRKGDIIRIGQAETIYIRQHMDLRPKTKDILISRKYTNRLSSSGGVFKTLEIGQRPGGFGNIRLTEEKNNLLRVEYILDTFPNPLIQAERDALKTYLIVEINNDNFDKLDSLVFFNLLDPINALWDVIREVSLTPVDSPIHTPGIGYVTDGLTQYITGFNPFVDGNNYKLDDALLGVFIADVGNLNDGSGHTPVGGGDVDSRADFFINITGFAKQSFRINTIQPNGTDYVTPLVDNQLLMSARIGSAQSSLYNDGVAVQSIDVISNTVPNANIDIGRLNNDGVGINYTQATYSLFIAGAGIGYNHLAGYLNLVAFNIELKNTT